ncbi:MAG: hypothetical protein IKQ32_03525 [Prevotella sp.]|nr:hypothetical protein [Prevotella sp.]
MCTVTLSYNKNDETAIKSLATLLATGHFVQLDAEDDLDIDYSDPSLFEEDPNIPIIDRDLTVEEFRNLLLEDIKKIYAEKNAI